MDTFSWVLLVIAGLGILVSAAMTVGRSRALAAEAAARAELAGVRGELERERGERERERREAAGEIDALEAAQRAAMDTAGTLRAEIARLEERIKSMDEKAAEQLRTAQRLHAERERALEESKDGLRREHEQRLSELNEKFASEFDALASKALRSANEEFLKRAEERFGAQREKAADEMDVRKKAVEDMVRPIQETLEKTRARLEEIDRARAATEAGLAEHLKQVARESSDLRAETAKLTRALSKPEVRGRYGEIQLRRVAELAGMTAYCDFCEQAETVDDEGKRLRPDMVVRLPSGRELAVDAKTNTQAYLDAVAAADAERDEHLERFARHVAEQATALGAKKYWARYEGSPELVVMFIPGDQFLDAALSRRPSLMEQAAERSVILATPSTLIGLLRAVAVGWREQRLEQQARELMRLGAELRERAWKMMEHARGVGAALDKAVSKYNDFVGSYVSRMEPTLKRFAEAEMGEGATPPELDPIEISVRRLPSAEPAPSGAAAPPALPLLDGRVDRE